MAGGLTVSVRQIASYPQAAVGPNDLVLLQTGGLGGPYASATLEDLLNPLAQGYFPLAVGWGPGPNSRAGQVFTNVLSLPNNGAVAWNAYLNGTWSSTVAGASATLDFNPPTGLTFAISAATAASGAAQPEPITLLNLTAAGGMSLPLGTLKVARDPASALEVATMQWVGNQTVASFNNRKGVVTLSAGDIYGALGICPPDTIATQCSVDAAICAAINDLLRTYPAVWSWMGRVGDVFLTVADMNFAAANNPAFLPPLTIPTPPSTAIDGEVITAAWVINYLTETAGLATEAWVTQQIQNALAGVVTSFNNRVGAIYLTLADVTGAGGAPVLSPSFSGIPTAPTANTGTSTAQLATTAFVMNTLTALTPGVVSFNGRAGTVVLDATDINDAGGALLASPNFTGVPAAPTAPNGTSTSQIATTAFVMSEIAASTAGVVSFNGRSGIVALQLADITGAGGAPLNNPAFTGQPAAPTAPNGTSSAQLATTAFVMNEINAISAGVTTFNGRSGAVTLTANDVTAVGGLTNPSAALTGTPTAPTPAPTDSSTNIATTAFVHAAVAAATGAAVSATPPPSPNTGTMWLNTGVSPPALMVYNGTAFVAATNTSAYAPLASPALTGTPTAPTATPATSATTQIATTAFVQAAIAAMPAQVSSFNGRTGGVTLSAADITGAGGATAAQLAGYLPLTGGVLTGPGNLQVVGTLNIGTSLQFYLQDAVGNARILNWTGGWYDAFQYSDGTRLQVGPLGGSGAPTQFTRLDNGGNLTVYGQVAAASGTFAAQLTSNGNLNVAGTAGVNGPLNVLGTATLAGVVCGSLGASAQVQSNNGRFISYNSGNNPAFTMLNTVPGINACCIYNQNNNLWFGAADGNGNPTGGWGWINSAGNMSINGTLTQGSDETTKNTIAPYAPGVSIAAQLSPKTFIYNNDATNTPHLGFIAQDVKPLIPDAIGENPAFNPADPPTLTLDPTAILAVAVNAIKQLISRVAALETALNITPTAAETA